METTTSAIPDQVCLDRDVAENLSFVPDEEGCEERYQEAVRVVGDCVPVVHQLEGDPVVENTEQDRNNCVRNPVAPGRGAGPVGIGEFEVRFLCDEIRCIGHGVEGPWMVNMTLYFTYNV